MPVEENENSVRIRVLDPTKCQAGSFRTITIDADKGIKAAICRPQGKDTTTVQVYIFDKAKGWTVVKAQAWVAEHKKSKGTPMASKLVEQIKALLGLGAPPCPECAQKSIETVLGTKFTGSPRNRFGTHSSYKFKGNYAAAWRVHFSKVGGGALTGAAGGPIRGTVRRTEMIAAAMKPACSLPATESIGARTGGDSPLPGDYPEGPKDYGLSTWDKPETDADREGVKLSCADLAVIKRAALAEIKWRANKREAQGKALGAGGFKLFKATDGSYRWAAWYTNAFQDREEEIFESKALTDFADYANGRGEYAGSGQHMPELWLAHVPLRWGKATFLESVGLYNLAAGTVNNTPAATWIAGKLEGRKLGVSHGYNALRVGRRYQLVRTFEISPLAPVYAANSYTLFVGGLAMGDNKQLVGALAATLGVDEATAKSLLDATGEAGETLKAAGVEWKALLKALEEAEPETGEEEGEKPPAPETETEEEEPGEVGKALVALLTEGQKSVADAITALAAQLGAAQADNVKRAETQDQATKALQEKLEAMQKAVNLPQAALAALIADKKGRAKEPEEPVAPNPFAGFEELKAALRDGSDFKKQG